MCKRTVGLSHTVCFILLLDCGTLSAKSVQQFRRKFFTHVAPTASTSRSKYPAHRQRHATLRVNFHRHLVCRAANALGLHFYGGRCVSQCLLEHTYGFPFGAIFDKRQRVIHRAASNTLFSTAHHAVDKHCNQNIVVTRIRNNRTAYWTVSSRHNQSPFTLDCPTYFLAGAAPPFGFFAPYLLRPCSRPFTPSQSNVPRT